jgi:hypothetical protein
MKSLISLCLLCLIPSLVHADYKILVDPDLGYKVVGAAWPGSTFDPTGNQFVVTGFVGDLPQGITTYYKYVDEELVNTNTGQQFIMAPDDDEIQANGTSWTTIRVTLTDSNGDPIDDDATEVSFTSSRGLLSSSNATLQDGTASVTITSVAESITSEIKAETGTISGTVFGLDNSCSVSFVP